jgi:hypothetical protein
MLYQTESSQRWCQNDNLYYYVLWQELDLLQANAEVFKLIGPVLVKQELQDAKQNVAKRMDYIRSELWVGLFFIYLL